MDCAGACRGAAPACGRSHGSPELLRMLHCSAGMMEKATWPLQKVIRLYEYDASVRLPASLRIWWLVPGADSRGRKAESKPHRNHPSVCGRASGLTSNSVVKDPVSDVPSPTLRSLTMQEGSLLSRPSRHAQAEKPMRHSSAESESKAPRPFRPKRLGCSGGCETGLRSLFF